MLDGFSADLSESRIIAVKGPSGCGKTTLLSVAAGIVKPCKGRFVCDKKISVMFQEPRLFPWLTARENITAVLHDRDKNSGYAERLLESVGISDFDKYPGQLSGGMKQRVSFARALAYDGELLLLDEPFPHWMPKTAGVCLSFWRRTDVRLCLSRIMTGIYI